MAARQGFEPRTYRLTAECSAFELTSHDATAIVVEVAKRLE